MRPALLISAGLALAVGGCAPERQFSGVWQQVCDAEAPCPEGGLVYALHLGRFGDAVTGLVVRYRDPGPELDAFRKDNDCGCFILDSGRAGGGGLTFGVEGPDAPGFPDDEGTRHESCVPLAPPECVDRRFVLDGDDDVLSGELRCGDAPGRAIRFEPVKGRARTRCVLP